MMITSATKPSPVLPESEERSGQEHSTLRSNPVNRRCGTDSRWARSLGETLAIALFAASQAGCSGILDPSGPVGRAERLVLFDAMTVMLVIIVPTIAATFAFAWWFRASNPRARYRPNWTFSGALELIVWSIPTIVVIFLGGIAWFGAHALDPYKPLSSAERAIEIEVVSLDWKWLFIYPEENVATVNQLVVPLGKPVHLRLTSSGVMNSFFVPQLGSQIYTMANMVSQLNLQADRPGIYHGLSAQFSGQGFADMHFSVRATSAHEYAKWLDGAKSSGSALDAATYKRLAAPSENSTPATYSPVDPQLFADIVALSLPAPGIEGAEGGQDVPPARGGQP